MSSGFSLLFVVLGPSGYYVLLMVEINVDYLSDIQDLGLALVDGKHDHGYVLLELGVLV